jgi:hypothetical protein
MSAPHARGLCSWCFRDLGDVVEEFNGGVGHPECVAWAWETIAAGDPDALPYARPRRLYRQDGARAFIQRLGLEASRLGIDPQRLRTAIEKAARHAS